MTGVGRGERDGKPCVVVFAEHPVDKLPGTLDGYPVTASERGPISRLS